MPRVASFRGLVYDQSVVGALDRVTAPPYDVISDEDRRRRAGASPFNVVHLDLRPDPGGIGEPHTGSADLLRSWIERGAMRLAPEPSYYPYEMRYRREGSTHRVRGVFCALQIEPPGGGVIPHEDVMPGPVEDRLALLRSIRCHLSAVYTIATRPVPGLARMLDRVAETQPSWQLVDEEGVEHRVWTASAEEPVDRWLADEPLLIADGHHRYATALAFQREMHASEGPGPWDRLLALVVEAGVHDVPVLPYHRIQVAGDPPHAGEPVPDLPSLLHELSDDGLRYGTAVRGGDGIVLSASTLAGPPPAVLALHREILDPFVDGLRGAGSVLDALRHTPDAAAALDAVRTGSAVAAWFLPPTTPERIREVAVAGGRFPTKSTFFWPKPRTGVVVMPLE